MPASDEYRGPERRARNERDIEVDKRLADLDTRMQHVEEVLVNEADPDQGVVAIVHKIKHDLANNTMTTNATSRKIGEVKESMDGVVTFMSTLDALNKLAQFGERLVKRVLPTATAVAAIWGAISIFWKGK